MNLQKNCYDRVNWMQQLPQVRVQWRVLVNTLLFRLLARRLIGQLSYCQLPKRNFAS